MQNTLHLHGFSDTGTIKSGRLWRSDQILRRVDTERNRNTNLLFWVKYQSDCVFFKPRLIQKFKEKLFYVTNYVKIQQNFLMLPPDVVTSSLLIQWVVFLWRFWNKPESFWQFLKLFCKVYWLLEAFSNFWHVFRSVCPGNFKNSLKGLECGNLVICPVVTIS